MTEAMTARQLAMLMADAADLAEWQKTDPVAAALKALIDSGHWFCALREHGNLPSEQLPLGFTLWGRDD